MLTSPSRTLTAKSVDAMQNPSPIYENVDSSDDIDEIIEKIANQGDLATQVRAILVKVSSNSMLREKLTASIYSRCRFPMFLR